MNLFDLQLADAADYTVEASDGRTTITSRAARLYDPVPLDVLSPEDEQRMIQALRLQQHDGNAGTEIINQIVNRDDYTQAAWNDFYSRYYAANLFYAGNRYGQYALDGHHNGWATSENALKQEIAYYNIAVSRLGTLYATHPGDLGKFLQSLSEDQRLDLIWWNQILHDLGNFNHPQFDIRTRIADWISALISDNPQWLSRDRCVDLSQRPYAAQFAVQLQMTLRDTLTTLGDSRATIADRLGLTGPERAIFVNHNQLFFHNRVLNDLDFTVFNSFLDLLPPHLPPHEVMVVYPSLQGAGNGEIIPLAFNGSWAWIGNGHVGDWHDGWFLAGDRPSYSVDGPSIQYFASQFYRWHDYLQETGFESRAAGLASAAGMDPANYLFPRRLSYDSSAYLSYPLDLIYDINGISLGNTEAVLTVAVQRLYQGRTQPLAQFLTWLDLWSAKGTQARGFRLDVRGNLDSYLIPIIRDGADRIQSFSLGDETWTVQYDGLGQPIGISGENGVSPEALTAGALINGNKVWIEFSEPLDPASAQLPLNYAVANRTVQAARVLRDLRTVELTLAPDSSALTLVTITGVADQTGNLIASPTTLPISQIWQAADLGAPAVMQPPSSSAVSGDRRILIETGGTQWGSPDNAVHSVTRPVTGNFDARVRISHFGSPIWSTAGLVAREQVGVPFPALEVTASSPSNGNSFDVDERNEFGTYFGWPGSEFKRNRGTENAWLRLVRDGDQFFAMFSPDGANWELIGQITRSLAPTLQVGVALSADNYGGPETAEAVFENFSIANPNSLVQLAATSTSLLEHDAPASLVAATLSHPAAADVHLRLIAGGSAQPGSDYNALPAEIVIPAGHLGATVPLQAIDDGAIEGSEDILLSLSPSPGYEVLGGPLTISIRDDDRPAGNRGGIVESLFWMPDASLFSQLIENPEYPSNPRVRNVVSGFESRPKIYNGKILSGFLVPPVTGFYKFFIASQGQARLYLTTDQWRLIAEEPQWSDRREYYVRDNGEKGSGPILLNAGQRYYIELIGVGYEASVAWQMPGGGAPANGSEPIPGQYLETANVQLPPPSVVWMPWPPTLGGNNHFYGLAGRLTRWSDAYAFAPSQPGAYLASIHSLDENQFIFERMGANHVWIGLTDFGDEGDFRWTSGEPLTFANWANGEPNNGGSGQDFAHIYPDFPVWDDLANEDYPGSVHFTSGAALESDSLPSLTPNSARILSWPRPVTGTLGQPLTLSLQIESMIPIVYQWRFKGADIPNANASSYQVSSFGFGDAGNYAVVLTSAAGTVTSPPIEVLPPPVTTALGPILGPEDVPANLNFTITEPLLQPADGLTFSVVWNGPVLGDVSFQVTGGNDVALTFTPTPNANGSSEFSIFLENGRGDRVLAGRVPVTLQPVNDPPSVGGPYNFGMYAGSWAGLPFNYSDPETANGDLRLTITSSNPALVPAENVLIRGNSLYLYPHGVATGAADITVTVADPEGLSASVTFNVQVFTPPNPVFANVTPVIVNDNGPASPYPSQINVSGLTAPIGSVSVTLENLRHPVPDDLDILLVGPQGQRVVLMSDALGANPLAPARLSFEEFGGILPDDGPIFPVGSYLPANYEGADNFPSLGTGPAGTDSMMTFRDTNGNGTWSLYIVDDRASDSGSLNGWILSFEYALPPTVYSPSSQIVDLGGQVNFYAGARGVGPFTFQWRKNGVKIDGKTNSSLTISNAQLADGASYDVVVSNRYGDTISDAAVLGIRLPGQEVYYYANGHYYEAVAAPGITWDEANAAALAKGGHLATATDQAENRLIYATCASQNLFSVWLGGFQPPGSVEPAGGWQWVTGEPFDFTNWYPGEPNNYNESQDRLVGAYYGERWDDDTHSAGLNGYVIEYPPLAGGPAPEIRNFQITPGTLVHGGQVSLQAIFVDADPGETHTARIDWGDGTVAPGSVNDTDAQVNATHTYVAPGVYKPVLHVMDAAGHEGLKTGLEIRVIGGPRYAAPFGPNGSWNTYEVILDPLRFAEAQAIAAQSVFGGTSGHLVVLHSSLEEALVRRLANFQRVWIGLTDYPDYGGTATPEADLPALRRWHGWQGDINAIPAALRPMVNPSGWATLNGEPYDYQHWYSDQPDSYGSAVYLDGPGWVAEGVGSVDEPGPALPYVIEYETRATTPPAGVSLLPSLLPVFDLPGPIGGRGYIGIQEIRAFGSVRLTTSVLEHFRSDNSAQRIEGEAPTVSFTDPDAGVAMGITPDQRMPFLSDQAGVNDDLLGALYQGWIRVPTAAAGLWTLRISSDDGFIFKLEGAQLLESFGNGIIDPGDSSVGAHPEPTADSKTRFVVNLAPGNHRFALVFSEYGGGAFVDLTAAPGRNPTDASSTQWQLIGSPNSPLQFVPENTPPLVLSRAFNLPEDSLLNQAAPGVLEGASDEDGDSFTASLVNGTSHGDVVLNPDGSFTYTPVANFFGTDSFSFVANDGKADSAEGVITIQVNSVNDLPRILAESPISTVSGEISQFQFQFDDVETLPDNLAVIVTSSNQALIPNGSIKLTRSGTLGTVRFASEPGTTGAVTLALVVTDSDGGVTTRAMVVNVLPGPNPLFVNLAPISLGAGAPPTPSVVPVSGVGGTVSGLKVALVGLTHPIPDDIGFLLVGPNGQKALLMRRAGGNSPLNNARITFFDFAAAPIPQSGPIVPLEEYRPADYGSGNFPAPAPAGPYSTSLAVFDGADPNGTWALYAVDFGFSGLGAGDFRPLASGSLGGWALGVDTGGAPFITQQPSSAIKLAGDSVTLSAAASGPGPISYQWQRNGTNLPGANSASLTLSGLQLANAGTYRLVASNTSGSVTSQNASVVVIQGPQSATGVYGQPTQFQVIVNSPIPVSYQWRFGASDIPGATQASYATPPFTRSVAGVYSVLVSSAAGNLRTPDIQLVAPPNAPPSVLPSQLILNEDTILEDGPPGVLAGASDPDNDPLSAILVSSPSHGAVTLNPDGSFSYQPGLNYFGEDSFTFKANDGKEDSAPGIVRIQIVGINDPPSAADDSYSVEEDSRLEIAAPGVLANDQDVDSPAIQAVLVTGPAHGTLSLNPNGSFIYTPARDYFGPDSFLYRASDTQDLSAPAKVTINVIGVNDPPVAANDSYALDEDTALSVPAPGVLGNDSDPDGNTITAVLASGPGHGTLTLNSNGSFSYNPQANYFGTDTFTYRASDGALTSEAASVTLTIRAVNDAPIAANDSYTVDEDGILHIPAPGLLANDFDVEGQTLTATLVTGAGHGNLSVLSDGSFTYTPEANYNGKDSFTYKASDGLAETSATVEITILSINDAPLTVNDSYSVDEDSVLTIAAPGVLGNDSDVDGDAITAKLAQGPTKGTLTLNSDGSFVYRPNANYFGADSFTYRASDGKADSVAARVSISVQAINDPPTISAIADVVLNEDQSSVPLPFVIGDVDSSIGSLVVTVTSSNPALFPQSNIALMGIGANRALTLTPFANKSGHATITVRVSDGLASSERSFEVTVLEVNDPPEISAIPNQSSSGGVPTGDIPFTVQDSESPSATLEVFADSSNKTLVPAANITLGGSDNARTIRIAPAPGEMGLSVITVTVRDPDGAERATSFEFVVSDSPLFILTQPASRLASQNARVELSVVARGRDPLSYQWFFNDQPLPGQTGQTLLIDHAVESNAGRYFVEVTNPDGTVRSQEALLSITTEVNIDEQPISRTVNPGAVVSFSVLASGAEPLKYEWFFNGNQIEGADQPTLVVKNAQEANAGMYYARVSNPTSSQTSKLASLEIAEGVTILAGPQDQTVGVGEPIVLRVQAVGGEPLEYQWYFGGNPLPGATSSELRIASATFDHAGDYRVEVGDPVSSELSDIAHVDVAILPTITMQPFGQTIAAGANTMFSVIVSGSDPLTFEWFHEGFSLGVSSQPTLTLNNITAAEAGSYLVRVSNAAGDVTSDPAILSVIERVRITMEPADQVRTVGETVRFSVAASGNGLSYQWFYRGSLIPGATSSELVLPNAPLTASGPYGVEVRNLTGATRSRDAMLTMVAAPTITRGPRTKDGLLNGRAQFSVEASGSAPLTYRWTRNNVEIPGATSSILVLDPVRLTDEADYRVQVQNSAGSALSAPATLRVIRPLQITQNPLPLSISAGGQAMFGVTATGSSPIAYQWLLNGFEIPGATSASLVVQDVEPADQGDYTVRLTNPAGSVLSDPATLTVQVPIVFTQQPANQNLKAGESARFQAAFDGTPPFTFQWQFNGQDLPGATQNTLTINNVQLSNQGEYRLLVSNPLGSEMSAPASLTVLAPPVITTSPQSQTILPGSTLVLQVVAEGTEPLSYSWTINGVVVPGATGPTLSIPDAQPFNSGTYTVSVANSGGVTRGAPAVITVSATSITLADNRADATIIPAGSGVISGHNRGATVESGEPNHAPGQVPRASVWMGWRAPLDGVVTFSTAGSGFDTTLAAYSFEGAQLVQQASDQDSGPYLTSIIKFNALAGKLYYLAIDGFNGAMGDIVLSWDLLATTPRLPVITREPGSFTALINTAAEFSVEAASADGNGLTYQWFHFDTPVPGANNPVLRLENVVEGDVGQYTVRVSNASDASFTVMSKPAYLQINLIETQLEGPDVGFVDKPGSSNLNQGQQSVRSRPIHVLQSVSRGFTGASVFSSVGSAGQVGEPSHCNSSGGASEWAIYQAPTDGMLLVTTDGSSFDTVVAVYSGNIDSFDSLTLLGCDNDSGANGKTSRIVVPVTAGQLYSIVVDGVNGASGVVHLNWTLAQPPVLVQQPHVVGTGLQALAETQVPVGSSITLGVTATNLLADTPLTYQWRRNGRSIAGATGPTLTLPSATAASAGPYTVTVANYAGTVLSETFDLSLISPVSIATAPQNQSVRSGESVIFTVAANGTAPIQYQWSFNGSPISGATNPTLELHNVQGGQAGTYQVRVSNSQNSVTAEATLSLLQPLAITQEPASVQVRANETATFQVAAVSSDPLSYQWRFNGVDLPGAESAQLVVSGVKLADVGDYSVLVSDGTDSILSASARLDLVVPVSIITQPRNLTVIGASTAQFEVITAGSEPIAYQWRFNGAPISGATSRILTLTTLTPSSAGFYSVEASNAGGSVTSSAATLILAAAPTISQQPASQAINMGSNVTFRVTADGAAPLSYQWRFNGVQIAGATGASLTLNNITSAQAGAYSVAIANNVGAIVSQDAMLQVNTAPTITRQPASKSVLTGSAVTFSVTALGTAPLGYQWFKGGASIAGATASTLTLTNVQSADQAVYYVRVSNAVGAVNSATAGLTILKMPEILSQSASQTVSVGANVTLNVIAIGTRELRYQWRRNGLLLPTGTNATLQLPGITAAQAGDYSVSVSNDAGTVNGSVTKLTVVSDQVLLTANRLGNQFILSLSGPGGRQADVEVTTDLKNWTVAGTVTLTGGQATFQQTIQSGQNRFYRTKLKP